MHAKKEHKVVPVKEKNITSLKAVSSVFSNPTFVNIVEGRNHDLVKRRVEKYLNGTKVSGIHSYNEFFDHLYREMLKYYRNEFVFKNEIVKKILLGRHNLNTATLLNEFQIGKSIADLVILNGTSTVYEIKTEFDSPERLLNQIADYRKVFLNVVIVCHENDVEKYKSFILKHSLLNIGIMKFTKRNTLSVVKAPIKDVNYLDITTMFKTLRKPEYLNIIQKHYGYVPDIPNTRIFRKCLEMSIEIESEKFNQSVFTELKKRTLREKKIISSGNIPEYMKHIAICSNFKKGDLNKLNTFLNKSL